MNTKSKNKVLNSSIYIVFTIITLTVMCLTLYAVMTFIARRNEPGTDTDPAATDSQAASSESNTVHGQPNRPQDTQQALKPFSEETTQAQDSEKPTNTTSLTFRMPVEGYLSKEFSGDTAVYSLTMGDYRTHTGIDLCAAIGSPVYACADGIVTDVYSDHFMGNCITIDHGNGVISHYMNLSDAEATNVQVGKSVNCGEMIGCIGETSLREIAEMPHLHFEMVVNNVSVDPLDYLPYDSEAAEALAHIETE